MRDITVASVEDLIVKNAQNLIGIVNSPLSSHARCSIGTVQQDLQSFVTIKLSTCKQLQWVLDSADNPENTAYATQADCPDGMTLREYLEFARIRSGGALQFLNLVRALLHDGMDFTLSYTRLAGTVSMASWPYFQANLWQLHL